MLYECPKGHYCPRKTPTPYFKKCPPGTYNDLMAGQNISACKECKPGYFCSGWGNNATTGPCSPGKLGSVSDLQPKNLLTFRHLGDATRFLYFDKFQIC